MGGKKVSRVSEVTKVTEVSGVSGVSKISEVNKIGLIEYKKLLDFLGDKVEKVRCNVSYGGVPLWWLCNPAECTIEDYDSSFCVANYLFTRIVKGEIELVYDEKELEEFKELVEQEHQLLWFKAKMYALKGLEDPQNRARYLLDAIGVFIDDNMAKKFVIYMKNQLGFGDKKVKDLDREGYKNLVEKCFEFFDGKRVYNLKFLSEGLDK